MSQQTLENTELFTDLSAEETETVNGGCHCYYGGYRRASYYGYRRHRYVSYYERPRYRYVSYRRRYSYNCW